MKTNKELRKEIKADIKRLKEDLKEAIYWEDLMMQDELLDEIETLEDELKRL